MRTPEVGARETPLTDERVSRRFHPDAERVYFLFCQAEDGIRDIGVTGVQTCALPISSVPCRAARCKGTCRATAIVLSMPQITSSTAPNGLPIHRVALEGTRATTILVAFDAGARTERSEENGMAHFLEHLVFKGGEIYDDYRKVNETAERMGGSLNAYTSHDLVAFHITVRAEAALEAIDLLTDFVGRPKIDAAELDRERGVVIQEIQRYKDQPSMVAEEIIDEAAFGDHPLGRTVLGPERSEEHTSEL